jgi:hypothetical protein
MIRRLVRDESGMTMGLTVIMVVLIGVMGAGLLTFVQNDLGSVIESNQGQTAFNLADSGTQAAKRHLLVDANSFNYDGNNATGTAAGGESPWSCVPAASNVCTAGSGKVIDLDSVAGTEARVWIKYLLPAETTSQLGDPNYAPELVTSGSNYEYGKDYFKVISEGTAGNARRKVEAIYQTYDLGTPRAYFGQGNIAIRGSANISNISIFSLGNITIEGATEKVTGLDLAYNDWYNPPFNTTARSAARLCSLPDGLQAKCAGMGAVGTISPSSRKIAGEDFDGGPISTHNLLQFIKKVPPDASQTTSQISFPFNYDREPDIEMMRQAAKMQSNGAGGDNYYELDVSAANVQGAWESGVPASDPDWPANSDVSTVVFVRFTNAASINTNLLTWDVDDNSYANECLAPPVKGTLVVENGNFKTQSSRLALRGTIVVKGSAPGVGTSGTGKYAYQDEGNPCMQSFTHASGDMDIGGDVGAFTEERGNRPGFFGVRQWSWRECYSISCS